MLEEGYFKGFVQERRGISRQLSSKQASNDFSFLFRTLHRRTDTGRWNTVGTKEHRERAYRSLGRVQASANVGPFILTYFQSQSCVTEEIQLWLIQLLAASMNKNAHRNNQFSRHQRATCSTCPGRCTPHIGKVSPLLSSASYSLINLFLSTNVESDRASCWGWSLCDGSGALITRCCWRTDRFCSM